MKIVVLGAGRVGASVAENLVSERNDITVIDIDAGLLAQLAERYDISTVTGNGILPSVLKRAGVEDADLFIAVAALDETNLVACRIAKQMFNVPRRIARVRSTEFLGDRALVGDDGFCADFVICPEESVTRAIHKLIEVPEALQVLEFGGGKVSMVAVRADPAGPLVGHPIGDLRRHAPKTDARIVAIFRNERPIAPEGGTLIEPGDEVFCIAATDRIRGVLAELRPRAAAVKHVLVAGGGKIGLRLAKSLAGDYQVKVIEPDKKRCEAIAAELGVTRVLAGDATDEALLAHEQVSEMDLFVAVTSDDEDNILSALLAKRMGAKRVVALINRRVYADLVQGGQIDIAIAPSQVTLSELLAYVRRGDVATVHSLRRGAAEAIELVAHGNAKTSAVIGRRIQDLDLFTRAREQAMIGAIVRGRGDAAEVLMAHHDTVIEADDHVIVFVAHKGLIPRLEKLFEVGVGYF